MEWLDQLNSAIDYLEQNLTSRIDYGEAARRACCSQASFQRMFAFVTDGTAAEYVRNRRLALAAEELLAGGSKVIDVALKYGYESPEAFTRAFLVFHGVSPTTARKLGIRTAYPRLSFQITINGGAFQMGSKPLVRIEEHTDMRVATFTADCANPEEQAWRALKGWAEANLPDRKARTMLGCAPRGHHPQGESHDANETDVVHEYWAQVALFAGEGSGDTFLGAAVADGPRGLYLIGDVSLNEYSENGTVDIGGSMMKSGGVMMECLKEMGGYALDLESRPYYEEHLFTDDWAEGPKGLAGFKLWLPIRKVG